MSDTKRTKGSSSRRAAGKSDVAVLDKPDAAAATNSVGDDLEDILGALSAPAPAPVPVETTDGLDDILGEIVAPPPPAPTEGLDDLLDEIAGPAPAEAAESLDDILSEIAGPQPVQAPESLDDILSELASPAEPAASLDDILSELAPPAKAASDSLDDIIGEVVPVAAAGHKPKGSRKRNPKGQEPEPAPAAVADDFSAMLDEMTAAAAPEVQGDAEAATEKPGIAARVRNLGGALTAPFKGTREISRKAHFGLLATIGVLASAVVGQATYIIARPAGTGHAREPAPAITVVPVDYSKVDLTLYHDKVRALPEGGRDLLRNPAIKKAVLYLDGGDALYREIGKLAQHSAAARRADIRNDRVTITSCDTPLCGDKSFKLVYHLQSKSAEVCMTEKYVNGTNLSYSFGPEGYSEPPSCDVVR